MSETKYPDDFTDADISKHLRGKDRSEWPRIIAEVRTGRNFKRHFLAGGDFQYIVIRAGYLNTKMFNDVINHFLKEYDQAKKEAGQPLR